MCKRSNERGRGEVRVRSRSDERDREREQLESEGGTLSFTNPEELYARSSSGSTQRPLGRPDGSPQPIVNAGPHELPPEGSQGVIRTSL